MDVRMPVLDGIEATREIAAADATVRASSSSRPSTSTTTSTTRCRRARAASSSRTCPPRPCSRPCGSSPAGEALLAPAITRRLIAEFARLRPRQHVRAGALSALTPRETEILGLVAEGLSNREIASRLVLSDETVKTHVSHVLRKLSLRDRAQAVVVAYESGLVVPRA